MYRVLLLTMLAVPLVATAQVSVPAGVESVSSGGYWINEGAAGRYRIVVENSGFETVTSRVYVQWIREPRSLGSDPEVVATVEPKLPFGQGVASLSARLVPLA